MTFLGKPLTLALVPMIFLGCVSFHHDAQFIFTGMVTKSSGGIAVIGANDGMSLCADVTYNDVAQGVVQTSRTQQICERVVTDASGRYVIRTAETLPLFGKSDAVEIKHLKIYLREDVYSRPNPSFHITPAKIRDIKIGENGATVAADLVVFDL